MKTIYNLTKKQVLALSKAQSDFEKAKNEMEKSQAIITEILNSTNAKTNKVNAKTNKASKDANKNATPVPTATEKATEKAKKPAMAGTFANHKHYLASMDKNGRRFKTVKECYEYIVALLDRVKTSGRLDITLNNPEATYSFRFTDPREKEINLKKFDKEFREFILGNSKGYDKSKDYVLTVVRK